MDIGNKIRDRRIALNLTQDDLAEILGYKNKSAITRIELGYAGVPKSKVPLFSRTLGIAPSELMGWADDDDMDHLELVSSQIREQDAKLQNELLESYNQLNTAGKVEANKRVAEMTEIPKYTEGE